MKRLVVLFFLVLSVAYGQPIPVEEITANPGSFRGKQVEVIGTVTNVKEGNGGSMLSSEHKQTATVSLSGGFSVVINLQAFALAHGINGSAVVKSDGNIWLMEKKYGKIGSSPLSPVLGNGSVVVVRGQLDGTGKSMPRGELSTETMKAMLAAKEVSKKSPARVIGDDPNEGPVRIRGEDGRDYDVENVGGVMRVTPRD